MKRQIERKLQVWKLEKSRKPLILKGLRQIGKTYLVQEWGKKQFSRVHVLNFETTEAASKIFEGDLKPERILKEISFLFETRIDTKKDLLFLDEIQACSRAITSLKYFHENLPELAVIAAGSLLGVYLGPVSFPVGKVEILPMYPLSFEEFLMALNETLLLELMDNWKFPEPIPQSAHQKLWERLTWYMVVGGLPEVVQTFCDHRKDLFVACTQARARQKQLLLNYYADFAKHSGQENAMHIERVWRAVPSQLAISQNSSAKRFQFTGVVPGVDRYQKLSGAIDWLKAAGLVLPTHIINNAALPLSAFCKEALLKLYLCDVGLLGAMSDLPIQAILEQNYGTYKGYFAENFVAQEFMCHSDERLICWEQDRSEIEFLRVSGSSVIPVEVKSGSVTRAKSLQKFMTQYQTPFGVILSGAKVRVQAEPRVYGYPLYMTKALVRALSLVTKTLD